MKEVPRKTKAKGDLPGSIYLRGKVYWIKYYKTPSENPAISIARDLAPLLLGVHPGYIPVK